MNPHRARTFRPLAAALLAVALWVTPGAGAEQKFIALSEAPNFYKFEVAADGGNLYMAGGQVIVLNAAGKMVDRFEVGANELVPLPDGWFIFSVGGSPWVGHLGMARPDGTEARRIVGKGSSSDDWTKPDLDMAILRADMTGWTSPCDIAVDAERKLVFAIDTTMAQRDDRRLPDPDWSRVAVFDFDGKYINDINRYNALATDARENDWKRTWYNDIEIDPARQRVYLTSRRHNEVWAFGYDGTLIKKVKPEHGANSLAVFKDGRVAVSAGWGGVVYDAELNMTGGLTAPDTEYRNYAEGIRDLETDDAGRLYAVTGDRTIAFIRWEPDLKTARAIGGPDYLRIIVEFPDTSVTAGDPMMIKTTVRGRPQPREADTWQAMIRPSDGSDLTWHALPTSYREGILAVVPPADLRGLYDLVVMFGDGPLELGNRQNVRMFKERSRCCPKARSEV